MAACGTGAADGDASDWISERLLGRGVRTDGVCVCVRPKEAGYTDGQNVAIEYRWAAGDYDKLPDMAVGSGSAAGIGDRCNITPANLAAKAATATMPVVFTTSSDPVTIGLVASLNRPGGNVTGVTQLNVEVGPKRLELAHELIPGAGTVALLVNPTNPQAKAVTETVQAAARRARAASQNPECKLRRRIGSRLRWTSRHWPPAYSRSAPMRSSTAGQRSSRNLAVRYAVPAIYQYDEFAGNGGLMSYGGVSRTRIASRASTLDEF